MPFQTALRAIVVAIPLVFVVGTVLVLSAPEIPLHLAKADDSEVKPANGDRVELGGIRSRQTNEPGELHGSREVEQDGARNEPIPLIQPHPTPTTLANAAIEPRLAMAFPDGTTRDSPTVIIPQRSPVVPEPLGPEADSGAQRDQIRPLPNGFASEPTSPRMIPEQPVPPPSSLDPYGDLKPEYTQPADLGFRFFTANDSRPLQEDSPGMILSHVSTEPKAHSANVDPRTTRVAIRRPKPSDYRIQFGPVEEPAPSSWKVAKRSPFYQATLSARDSENAAGPLVLTQPAADAVNMKKIEAQLAGMNQRIDLVAQAQMQQMQNDQLKFLQEMHQQLESMKKRAMDEATGKGAPGAGQPGAQPNQPNANPAVGATRNELTEPAEPPRDPVLKVERSDNSGGAASANDRFSLQIEDTPITEVLEMLGQLAGKNVLTSAEVKGLISTNLQEVTVEEALDALLKVQDFAYERDEKFIYVMTQAEADAKRQAARKVVSKIYRPNYVSAKELQTLVTPLLTQNIGVVAVTTAPEVGLSPDSTQAGGDSLSQQDALLVQDYEDIVSQVDQIVEELDVPPAQVVIEALILQVDLNDDMSMGVNFALLGDNNKNFSLVGNGQTLNGSVGFPQNQNVIQGVGSFVANTAGLKYGFIQGDVAAFVNALETITDVNTVASPTIRALNKQKAQLIIGQQLAYETTTTNGNTTQTNVNFLDVGTKLYVRPFIASDGYVRMEVNPELSQGSIDDRDLPNTTTAQVTTNVMIKDGATIVIGGLIRESVTESTNGVPLLSSLPGVGGIFQNKSDTVTRTELMVLLTPRIVSQSEAATDGEIARYEQLDRARDFKHSATPAMRMQMSRTHFEWAQRAFESGDYVRASYHIKQAARLSPNNLEVLRLKKLIDSSVPPRSWLPGSGSGSSTTSHSMPPAPSGPTRRGPVARRLRPGPQSPTRLR